MLKRYSGLLVGDDIALDKFLGAKKVMADNKKYHNDEFHGFFKGTRKNWFPLVLLYLYTSPGVYNNFMKRIEIYNVLNSAISCPDLHSFYLDSVEKVDNHSVQIKYRANMDLSEAIMKIVGYFGLQYIYNRMR